MANPPTCPQQHTNPTPLLVMKAQLNFNKRIEPLSPLIDFDPGIFQCESVWKETQLLEEEEESREGGGEEKRYLEWSQCAKLGGFQER